MIAQGEVESREPRVYGSRGRGRPAKVFALTQGGRDRFEQRYDDLAVQALRFLAETGGDAAVLAFARRRGGEPGGRHRAALGAGPGPRPAPALARARSAG